jgi:hypothetical protein
MSGRRQPESRVRRAENPSEEGLTPALVSARDPGEQRVRSEARAGRAASRLRLKAGTTWLLRRADIRHQAVELLAQTHAFV